MQPRTLTVKVDSRMYTEFKQACIADDVSMSKVVRDAIHAKIQQHRSFGTAIE